MAIVGPDFMEPDLDSGYDVDGVPGAKRRRFGEAPGEEFNLAKDVIRYRNQAPSFVRDQAARATRLVLEAKESRAITLTVHSVSRP